MDAGSDPAPGASVPGRRRLRGGPVGRIVSGLAWNTVGQLVTLAINVGLTPFILDRLGASRYGLFALVSTFSGLVSNLDGGLGPAASRFFALRAGAGDRRGRTALLATLLCLLTVVTGAVALVGILLAPDIASLLHASPRLRHEAVQLLRLFLVLGVVSALQQAIGKSLAAEHRWRYLNVLGVVGTITNAVLVVVLLSRGMGLVGLFWAAVGARVVWLVPGTFSAGRQLVWSNFRFMSRAEVRELIRYASRVQVAAVASSFTKEVNSLLVALLFPVRFVAYYSIGSNFATQLVTLPTNAMAPISVTLSRTFGRASYQATLEEFTGLQRLWVRSVAAIPLIGAASAYFAIDRWLGHADRLAGVVATILLVGQAMTLLSLVLDTVVKTVNHPELESRYLGAGAVAQLAIAVSLAFPVGMLGVPTGTAIGAAVSVLYFLRLVRSRLGTHVRSFLAEIPKAPLAASVCVTLLLEVPAFQIAPNGAAGLLVCAIPAVIGLAVYGLAVTGVRSTFQVLGRLSSGATPPSMGS